MPRNITEKKIYWPGIKPVLQKIWNGPQATSGVGYEVTQANRLRKAMGLLRGRVGADRHLDNMTLSSLRERCRAYDRQGSLFSGILNRALDNIFGANFDFIPSTGDRELDQRARDYIGPRMERGSCDAAGVMDFAGMAKTALRAVWNDGDCLLVQRPEGYLVPFEADQIVTPKDKGSRRIIMGVELNDLNRPLNYWVSSDNTRNDYGLTTSTLTPTDIPAAWGIRPAYRTRFAQTRGLPFLAAIIGFYDRFNNYLDYEAIAAEINSMLGFKITRKYPEESPIGADTNSDTGSAFEKVQKMEPGQIFDFSDTGEDVEMIGSMRPGDNFEPYSIACCRIIGVGIGFPLELILLDFSRTNYSSARASLGEARRMFRVWQKFSQIEICMPWYQWQISRGIADGSLPARSELYRARCQWPAWEYIDPKKEAEGNAIAMSINTKSVSQCIRETGNDPDEVFDEIAMDMKKLKERGIPASNPTLKVGTAVDNEEEEEKEEESGNKTKSSLRM